MTCLSNVENNDWDATRAILQFISTLLPVYYPSEPYGYTLINACITALTTGQSVSMLVPAYSECLLSLILNNTQISQEWVHRVILSLSSSPSSLSTEDHTKVQTIVRPVMEILFPMVAKDGQSSKPRAKMLINDMSKIFNGEITLDCLLTYSL